jgi:hypothetical protein
MASDRSSRSSQDVEIPSSIDTNLDGEEPAVNNRDSATTNGHANTKSKKTFKGKSPPAIKIEPSFEEGEERPYDEPGTSSVPSDDGDGQQAAQSNNTQPNVCFFRFPSSPEH